MLGSLITNPTFSEDLIKIVVDKGAIGGMVVLLGFYFNKLVERYKSRQAIIQDQQKILFPQALKILDAADEFEELVEKNLDEVDGDIAKVATLLRQVVAQHGPEIELDQETAKEALVQPMPWSRRQIIDLPICNGKSLRNLLLETVGDQDLGNCISRMTERHPDLNPYLPSAKSNIVAPHNPYVLDVENAREKLVTGLRDLKPWPLPLSGSVPPPVQYRSPVNEVMVGLIYLYLHELTQPRTWQVLTAYQRLLGKAAEIPLIHWSASEAPDVSVFLSKDPHFAALSNLRAMLVGGLDAYVPYEYLAPQPRPTLSPFDMVHTQIRLSIRRMLLPGHLYK